MRARSPRRSATCPTTSVRAASTSIASVFTRTTSGRSEVNWKVALENYLECYHCAVAHPGFSKVIDVDPDAYARSSSERCRRARSVRSGRPRSRVPARCPTTRAATCGSRSSTSSSRTRRSTSHRGRRTSRSSAGCPIGPKTTIEVTDYFFDPDESDERIRELLDWDSQVGRGGRVARPLGAARSRLRQGATGPSDGGEREADRGLPATRLRRRRAPRRLTGYRRGYARARDIVRA